MITQILNFGLPAQIDVRVVGRDRATNLRVAGELRRRVTAIPGIADAHLQQELDAPAFMAKIDRSRALELGLNAQNIANDINISLSSSEQVSPNFWTDPASGIPYYIAVQTPEPLMSSLGELGNTPVSTAIAAAGPPIPGLLSNVATLQRDSVPTNLNQTNIQPVYDVYASVQGRDLGSIADDLGKIVAELQKELWQHDPGSWSDPEHARILSGSGDRVVVCCRVCLSADGCELPKFRRPVRGDPGAASDLVRHCHDAVHNRHDAERPLADGCDHGGGRRLSEFHSAGHVRARAAA